MKWLRKLYDWVIHWAKTPYSLIVLFVLAFIEALFFPIPPDILLIAMALSKAKSAFKYAFICSIGSIFGGILGYFIGYEFWNSFSYFFYEYIPGFTKHRFNSINNLYERYNFWIVFTAGFTPIPYKIISLSAGFFNINFLIFIFASIISRSARFFLVAGLIYFFGSKINILINRYFNLLTVIFTILLIGFYFIYQFI